MYYTKKMKEEEKHTYISYIEQANEEMNADLTEEEQQQIINEIMDNEYYKNTKIWNKWKYESVKFHIRHEIINKRD